MISGVFMNAGLSPIRFAAFERRRAGRRRPNHARNFVYPLPIELSIVTLKSRRCRVGITVSVMVRIITSYIFIKLVSFPCE
jgi:hypothetical protein